MKLPGAAQREAILRLTLLRHAREVGPQAVEPALLPLPPLLSAAAATATTSGSLALDGIDSEAADAAAAAAGLLANAGGRGGEEEDAGPAADEDAVEAGSALRWLAEATEDYSGSDLVQLCSQAAAVPIQEHIE